MLASNSAALDYSVNSYLGFPNEKEATQAVALAIQQRPGSNAIATAHAVRDTMDQLSKDFPKGLEYRVIYDPTVFVRGIGPRGRAHDFRSGRSWSSSWS